MELPIYCSPNGFYTVTYNSDSMTIYKYERPLFTWALNVQDIYICGITYNGSIACIMDNKFYIFKKEGNIIGPLKQLSPEYQNPNVSIKYNIKIDDKGSFICYERLIDKSTAKKINLLSELIIYNLVNNKSNLCKRFSYDNNKTASFSWNISRNFSYLTCLEKYYDASKEAYNLYLMDLIKDTPVYMAKINDIYEPAVMVNINGEVLLSCRSGDVNFLLFFELSGNKVELIIPKYFHLYSLGKDFCCLKHENLHQYMFVNIKTKDESPADLTILLNNNVKFNIFITPEDQIVFIYKTPFDKEFRRIEGSFSDFSNHLKRWETSLEYQHKKSASEIDWNPPPEEEVTHDQEKVAILAQSAYKHLNLKREKIFNKLVQIRHLLQKLNEQYLNMILSESQYKNNREKLMEAISKLDTLSEKFKIDIAEDFPPDLTNIDELEWEINKLLRGRKISLAIAGKWQERIRLKKGTDSVDINKTEKIAEQTNDDSEEKKITQLLDLLEERFIKGEISEKVFYELSEKYTKKLKLIQKN